MSTRMVVVAFWDESCCLRQLLCYTRQVNIFIVYLMHNTHIQGAKELGY